MKTIQKKRLKIAGFIAILLFFVAGSTATFAGFNSNQDTDEPDTNKWTTISFPCVDHQGHTYSQSSTCFKLGNLEYCVNNPCPEDTTPDPKPGDTDTY